MKATEPATRVPAAVATHRALRGRALRRPAARRRVGRPRVVPRRAVRALRMEACLEPVPAARRARRPAVFPALAPARVWVARRWAVWRARARAVVHRRARVERRARAARAARAARVA